MELGLEISNLKLLILKILEIKARIFSFSALMF
jgi:hypothetical protein